MKTILVLLFVGCLMMVLNPLASSAGTSPFITEGKSNGVIYASGGVGLDEQMEMNAMAKNYNLKMVFAEAPRDYVSGVKVKIVDHSGKVLLEATSSGPWFFAKLPQGDYRLIASFHDHQELKNLNVASGHQTVEFFWKA
jgi:hypothetical protein